MHNKLLTIRLHLNGRNGDHNRKGPLHWQFSLVCGIDPDGENSRPVLLESGGIGIDALAEDLQYLATTICVESCCPCRKDVFLLALLLLCFVGGVR